MTRYIGANCLVNYRDEPRVEPFNVFIKFGSFDEDTATIDDRVIDESVFFYCVNVNEFFDIVRGGSDEFFILAYELMDKGE